MQTLLLWLAAGLLVVILLASLSQRTSGASGAPPLVQWSDLWRWNGTVGRGPYALVGVIGFAIKHNLDRFIASHVFHRPWDIFNYLTPLEKALQPGALSNEDAVFLATMVAAALPFIWVGVLLTIRRLRATGLPTWLVAIFFLPVVNLAFFLLLAVLPSRQPHAVQQAAATARPRTLLGTVLPDHPVGAAAMALLLTVPVGLAIGHIGISAFMTYGWGLFVGLPFCVGLVSVLFYGYHRPRRFAMCLSVALIAVCLLGLAMFALAVEGVICLAMAAPIGGTLALIGGAVGYLIQRRPMSPGEAPTIVLLMLVFMPVLMGAEWLAHPQAPLLAVRTAIDIHAPPERVWRHVVAFAQLPKPDEWLFRLGIAYPVRATIYGRGVGAVRHCIFSTGPFVEPIEVWDEPRLLKFLVTANPPPMQEWTPYRHLHAPHLDGFLVSEGGQFLLTPRADGTTRLEGTTWYRHHLWPAGYWRWWSDAIIHRIHLRVLRHIQHLAQQAAPTY